MTALPEASVLLPFALAVLVIAITPGPDMTFFVGRALSQGRAAGFAAMAGAMTGILVHTMLVAFGLSALIVAAPQAFLALKAAGAAYLLWLAVQAIRHGSMLEAPGAAPLDAGLGATWAAGLAINLLNPKIVLFFMTFLPQFVSLADPNAAAKLVTLGALFVVISLPVVAGMILAADKVSATLRGQPRVSHAIDWIFAGVFTAFAVQIMFSQSR